MISQMIIALTNSLNALKKTMLFYRICKRTVHNSQKSQTLGTLLTFYRKDKILFANCS